MHSGKASFHYLYIKSKNDLLDPKAPSLLPLSLRIPVKSARLRQLRDLLRTLHGEAGVHVCTPPRSPPGLRALLVGGAPDGSS